MCFKTLDFFNHVLDEAGSPVSTIDNIRSFNTLLLQSPDKDLSPKPPDIVKKGVPTIFGTVGPSRTGPPRDSWQDNNK